MARITYKEMMWEQMAEVNPTECPTPTQEYFFMHSRQWRFDYAIPSLKIAIEYQGGVYMKTKSGHTNVRGQTRDWEKLNEAQIRGWLVICANPETIKNRSFIKQLERAIKVRRGDIRYE